MREQQNKITLPVAWPEKPPIYDIAKSYMDNASEGPFFKEELPRRTFTSPESWGQFLGLPVASFIGVPAGPLLNAQWVAFAAKMGFDIVTYKTIRSEMHPAHPLPNMVYVATQGMLDPKGNQEALKIASHPPLAMDALALTNSFGIPSNKPSFLVEDIARAKASLAPGQVLIVSIVGTPRQKRSFPEDFALATRIALEGGAPLIEADFSCPNVASCEGSIYCSPQSVYDLSIAVKRAAPQTPLIIKVGLFSSLEQMRSVMVAAARAGVEALCGINTMSRPVVLEDGKTPALGPQRLTAGVCGGPIRAAALDFMAAASKINREEKLGLTLMGTGGVTLPEHFDLFFEAGAQVAMSAIGMLWDPYLALRYHQSKR